MLGSSWGGRAPGRPAPPVPILPLPGDAAGGGSAGRYRAEGRASPRADVWCCRPAPGSHAGLLYTLGWGQGTAAGVPAGSGGAWCWGGGGGQPGEWASR